MELDAKKCDERPDLDVVVINAGKHGLLVVDRWERGLVLARFPEGTSLSSGFLQALVECYRDGSYLSFGEGAIDRIISPLDNHHRNEGTALESV